VESRSDNAGSCRTRRRDVRQSEIGRTVVAVSLVEDGFAIASTAFVSTMISQISQRCIPSISRKPRFKQANKDVHAVYDGRAAH
jgi:hypothetical protein